MRQDDPNEPQLSWEELERLRVSALVERFVDKSDAELASDPEWRRLSQDHHFALAVESARRMVGPLTDVSGASREERLRVFNTVLFDLLDLRGESEENT